MGGHRKKKVSFALIIFLLIGSIFIIDLARRYYSGEFEKADIELDVLYSSEKATWLESVAPIFEEEWAKNETKGLKLVLTPIGTRKGSLDISKEVLKPTVWSPASTYWFSIMNSIWLESHNTPIVNVDNSPPLVISPTVIATWESYYKQHNITGFETLHELALKDPGFTYAHTDPQSSNSGFGAVILEASVAAGKAPVNLTLDDLGSEKVQKWMKELESCAIQYGESTGFLGKLMQTRGPDVLKVAVIYENLVIEKNKGIENLWPGDKLIAIYPNEGTILNDHPYAILNAPWVTPEQRYAAEKFLAFLLRPDIQEKAIETGFRPAVPVSEDKLKQYFDPAYGVKISLDDIKIYNMKGVDGKVLSRIPDLWMATRARGGTDTEQAVISKEDYIFFSTLLLLFAALVAYNVYLNQQSKKRRLRSLSY